MTDKLRILFITSDKFPPFRPAAKAIFAEELCRRGHTVDWLIQAETASSLSGDQPFGDGVAYVAPTDEGESRLRRLRKYWWDFTNDLRLFSLLKSGRYDLVQVKDKYLSALMAILAARLYKVPFFFWLAYPHAEASLHAAREGVARYRVFYFLRGMFQRFVLYRLIIPRARHVFVQSEQMRKDISEQGIAMKAMTAVPSSLDLVEIRDHVPECVGKPPGARWLVYLGTLIGERRLDFLVRMLAEVRRAAPGAQLVLVGKGRMAQDEAAIMDEARRLGVEASVSITGWLPMHRAWDYVLAADVCLSPYFPTPILNSTSPTKLIEYMAFGRAVVANDHPEQSQVITESGAGLCCAWDEEAFSEAVVYLLEHEKEREAMELRGPRYVERHRTHVRMADLVLERYRSVVSEHREHVSAAPR